MIIWPNMDMRLVVARALARGAAYTDRPAVRQQRRRKGDQGTNAVDQGGGCMRSTAGGLSILNNPFLALAAKASAWTFEMPG